MVIVASVLRLLNASPDTGATGTAKAVETSRVAAIATKFVLILATGSKLFQMSVSDKTKD